MAADGASEPFAAGRANLRDTAKWMVSGIAGAATLIVGSSTISQLGALDPHGWRLWVALGTLIAAAGLCWVPFSRAVAVLRSELLTLEGFVGAPGGEFRKAADDVSSLMGASLEGMSLRNFVLAYRTLRSKAWKDAKDQASAEKAVAGLDSQYLACREACVSQLVAVRFDALVWALKYLGSVILLFFLAFTWTANPPKDVKLLDKPYEAPLTDEDGARLSAAGVPAACYAPGARLVAVAAPPAGPQTAVLIPPRPGIQGCAVRTVTVSRGRVVRVD
jgi:hypothetical protein